MGALSALMVAIGRESVKTWTLDHSIYQMYGLTDAGIILRTWRPDVKNGMAQMRRWLRYAGSGSVCRLLACHSWR